MNAERKGLSGTEAVLGRIRQARIIPIFSHGSLPRVKRVVSILAEGGLDVVEFTSRARGAMEVFEHLVPWVRSQIPHLLIGLGTVVKEDDARRGIAAGADFTVSPFLSSDLMAIGDAAQNVHLPGCATPTEIQRAYDLGASMVKLFPAGSLGGPSFLAAARAPCPWIEAVPTGGIELSEEAVKPWFTAGAVAVGIGSALIEPSLVEAEHWEALAAKVRIAVGLRGR